MVNVPGGGFEQKIVELPPSSIFCMLKIVNPAASSSTFDLPFHLLDSGTETIRGPSVFGVRFLIDSRSNWSLVLLRIMWYSVTKGKCPPYKKYHLHCTRIPFVLNTLEIHLSDFVFVAECCWIDGDYGVSKSLLRAYRSCELVLAQCRIDHFELSLVSDRRQQPSLSSVNRPSYGAAMAYRVCLAAERARNPKIQT